MRTPFALLLSVTVLVAVSVLVPPAEAGGRRWLKEPTAGFVTAESRYGAGSITAPVRLSARGRREVRLPGGTWIECRQTCTNTLRQETIDFWHIRSGIDSSGNDGPGYFSLHLYW
jgi:hypothetical protein